MAWRSPKSVTDFDKKVGFRMPNPGQMGVEAVKGQDRSGDSALKIKPFRKLRTLQVFRHSYTFQASRLSLGAPV